MDVFFLPTFFSIETFEQFLFLQPPSLEGLILFIVPTTLSFGMGGIKKKIHHSNHLKKFDRQHFFLLFKLLLFIRWLDIFFHYSIPTIIFMKNYIKHVNSCIPKLMWFDFEMYLHHPKPMKIIRIPTSLNKHFTWTNDLRLHVVLCTLYTTCFISYPTTLFTWCLPF